VTVNEQLKKRLIGAVVLTALAVIFIPMLLDRGSESQIPTFGSNVPPKPETEFKTIDVPLQEPPPAAEEAPLPVTSMEEEREIVPPNPNVVVTRAKIPAFEEEPAASRREESGSSPAKPKQSTKPTPPVTSGPEKKPVKPATTAKPAATTAKKTELPGWAVQLGFFEEPANALSLRDRLRKKGFTAFVVKQKSGKNVKYRVRVGPELKRENADLLKAKLAKAGFDGVVMTHP
jgi:DedD protein